MFTDLGPILFGAVIGWMAHSAYWTAQNVTAKWISSMLGVIGGASITGIFVRGTSFDAFCTGLGVAFFLRMILFSPLVILLSERVRRKGFSDIPRSHLSPFNKANKAAE